MKHLCKFLHQRIFLHEKIFLQRFILFEAAEIKNFQAEGSSLCQRFIRCFDINHSESNLLMIDLLLVSKSTIQNQALPIIIMELDKALLLTYENWSFLYQIFAIKIQNQALVMKKLAKLVTSTYHKQALIVKEVSRILTTTNQKWPFLVWIFQKFDNNNFFWCKFYPFWYQQKKAFLLFDKISSFLLLANRMKNQQKLNFLSKLSRLLKNFCVRNFKIICIDSCKILWISVSSVFTS